MHVHLNALHDGDVGNNLAGLRRQDATMPPTKYLRTRVGLAGGTRLRAISANDTSLRENIGQWWIGVGERRARYGPGC
jgi:hypothetical protein